MYIVQQDLIDRYGEAQLLLIADRDNDGAIDTAVIAKAIGDAEAIVNSHVRGRYAVPLAPVPDEVPGIACAIARWGLYEKGSEIPAAVTDGYKAAMAMLASIRDGDMPLPSAAASSADPAATGAEVEYAGDAALFTSESLRGF